MLACEAAGARAVAVNTARCVWLNSILLTACAGCEGGTPVVIESQRVPSSDKVLEVVVERVDNGLGFGQGAVYDEIHVVRRGTPVLKHGDHSNTVLFYVMEETDADNRATASWRGPRQLVITYDGRRTPGHFVRRLGDVSVGYAPGIRDKQELSRK